MNISGLQKTTVVDYPGEIACTIFLRGCNFRCGFCHNPNLVVKACGDNFSEEEVLIFLKKRVGKLDAVCITGGEPLMTLDINFVKRIREMGYKIKIDTNGSFPEKLKEVIDLGLVDYIAMDIKGAREDYSSIVGVDVDLEKIEKSIKIIHDFGSYEFRTTVVGRFHNSDSLVSMGKWLNSVCDSKPNRFYLQGFTKENAGMIDEDFNNEPNVSEGFLEELKEKVSEFFEEVGIRR
ncbi:MAG: anaerobic ribonucleoside-triphosphate reductase activating protein [Nanoarchaeota archaeon]|nr:anaerobic ribonucleoside-triphosphate reductase activating protein [Nanoarchaeota archaeon]